MDPRELRRDFPIFEAHPDLVFLDSAASAQKPRAVIRALARFYETTYANVHRGSYPLSEAATEAFEDARRTLAAFLGTPDPEEVVFVRNATEGLNLLAHSLSERFLGPGDLVVVTEMEHHANLVPWQQAARRKGGRIRAVPFDDQGRLDLAAFERLLAEEPRIVALTHMSNVLGTVNPVADLAKRARAAGAIVVVDGAQGAPHLPVNVRALGADFYATSGHKMLGPTGASALWGRRALWEELPPFLTGGGMIERVEIEESTFAPPPTRFEAGTPPFAEAVGLAAAARYLTEVGMENVWRHDRALVERALIALAEVPDLRVFGPAGADRGGVVSFAFPGVHAHDLATFLAQKGVAVRSGHHCAQPLHRRLGVAATTRASFYLYNTEEEVDRLAEALLEARRFFASWIE